MLVAGLCDGSVRMPLPSTLNVYTILFVRILGTHDKPYYVGSYESKCTYTPSKNCDT